MSGATKCFGIDLGKLYNPYGNRLFNIFDPLTQTRETVKMQPISILLKPVAGYEKLILASLKNKTAGNEGSTPTGRPIRNRTKIETQPQVAPVEQTPKSVNCKPKAKPKPKSKPPSKKAKIDSTQTQPAQIKSKTGPARKRNPKKTVTGVATAVMPEPQPGSFYGGVKVKTEPVEITVPIHPQSLMYEGMAYLSPYCGASEDLSQYNPSNGVTTFHQPDGYECPTCFETFIIKEDLLIHRRSHRFSYACDQCTKTFDTLGTLSSHAKSHAAVKMKKDASRNGHASNASASASLDNRPYSPPPLTFAELSQTYIACDACGESFDNSESLKVHYMGHFGLSVVETPITPQTQLILSDNESGSGTDQDQERNLALFETNTFPYPPTPNSAGRSEPEQKQLEMMYNEFLIKTEGLKRDAFQLNDPALLNKMLEVESLVATRIMELRGPVSYSPPGLD